MVQAGWPSSWTLVGIWDKLDQQTILVWVKLNQGELAQVFPTENTSLFKIAFSNLFTYFSNIAIKRRVLQIKKTLKRKASKNQATIP